MLGHVPWGDECGGGRWITQHGGEFRALPTDFSISSGPANHSPTHSPAEPVDTHPTPPQMQIHLLQLTSTPKNSSDLPLSDCFVLWELSWSFPKGDAHSPQHTQGAAPQTTPFLCIFTLCTHWWCWWCWLKVVVMETPFFSFC